MTPKGTESSESEVGSMLCPKCGGDTKVIAFFTDYSVIYRIVNQLKLTFVAGEPPPPHIGDLEFLLAAEAGAEYFSLFILTP